MVLKCFGYALWKLDNLCSFCNNHCYINLIQKKIAFGGKKTVHPRPCPLYVNVSLRTLTMISSLPRKMSFLSKCHVYSMSVLYGLIGTGTVLQTCS